MGHRLATSHKLGKVGKVMLHVPTICPPVVLAISCSRTDAATEAIIEVRQEVAFLVFRMEETRLWVPDITIVVAELEILSRVIHLAHIFCNPRQAPLVVRSAQSNCDRLSLLEAIHGWNVLFLSYTKSREVAIILVELVETTCWGTAPRHKSLFLDASTAVLEASFGIHFEPFPECICHHRYAVITVHPSCITRHLRESRHPHRAHLLGHTQVALDDILFFLRLNQGSERMSGTISVPNPVVCVERLAAIFVHFTVESREVSPVFTEANGSFEGSIIRGIKDNLLVVGAALNKDIAQRLVPFLATILDDFGHIELLTLFPTEVLLGLILAYEGNAITELNLLRAFWETESCSCPTFFSSLVGRYLTVAKQTDPFWLDVELTRKVDVHVLAKPLTCRCFLAVNLHPAVFSIEKNGGRLA